MVTLRPSSSLTVPQRYLSDDDGLWVTLAKNGGGTVTVTGQNHNFYSMAFGGKKS
jgi:hypothetical protein